MTIELLQIAVILVGFTVNVGWSWDCFANLRRMYRSGENGVLEHIAWEKLIVSLLHLFLQLMWLSSSIYISRIHPQTAEGEFYEGLLIRRGMVGSFVILMVVAFKAWSWWRIRVIHDALKRKGKSV